MKIYLIFCLLVCASALNQEGLKAQWESYKAQHGKEYHPSVEADHFENFIQSTITIEEHNARYDRGEVGYKLGHNQFSDLSHEDVESKVHVRQEMDIEEDNRTDSALGEEDELPETIDWTDRVTPVKDQGRDCKFGYAFAAVDLLEFAIRVTIGYTESLSVQQMVDCVKYSKDNPNLMPEGGKVGQILDHIYKKGITSEDKYNFTSGKSCKRGKCKTRTGKWGRGFHYRTLPKGSEYALADTVARYGPVVVSISNQRPDFKLYKEGVYSNKACSKKPNHHALLVGYGFEDGDEYWLIKNSWGTDWGEKGYLKLLRGENQCGIVTNESVYIVL